MASAAEQLAASINLSAFSKATELKSRIWFTLGALVIYRLGTYIPIPGIDPGILQDVFSRNAGSRGRSRGRSEEHTSELQSRRDLVCRLLLEKKKQKTE